MTSYSEEALRKLYLIDNDLTGIDLVRQNKMESSFVKVLEKLEIWQTWNRRCYYKKYKLAAVVSSSWHKKGHAEQTRKTLEMVI